MDYSTRNLAVSDFVMKELVLYVIAKNRSQIPSILDGQKISERKVLYAGLLSGSSMGTMKVIEMADYVSALTGYRHRIDRMIFLEQDQMCSAIVTRKAEE